MPTINKHGSIYISYNRIDDTKNSSPSRKIIMMKFNVTKIILLNLSINTSVH